VTSLLLLTSGIGATFVGGEGFAEAQRQTVRLIFPLWQSGAHSSLPNVQIKRLSRERPQGKPISSSRKSHYNWGARECAQWRLQDETHWSHLNNRCLNNRCQGRLLLSPANVRPTSHTENCYDLTRNVQGDDRHRALTHRFFSKFRKLDFIKYDRLQINTFLLSVDPHEWE
jgi:hypothetical protein